MRLRTSLTNLMFLSAFLLPQTRAEAQHVASQAESNKNAPVQRFVDDGVWAIMCTDIDAWAALEGKEQLIEVLKIRFRSDTERRDRFLRNFELAADEIHALGMHKGWMLLSPEDALFRGGFPMVFSVDEHGKPERARQMAENIAISSGEIRDQDGQVVPTFKSAKWLDEDRVVVGGTEEIVEHYLQVRPAPRPDLMKPLEELMHGGAIMAVVLSPDPHARRAMRELWPDDLPEPLNRLTGEVLADEFRWLGFELRTEPRVVGRLILEMNSEELAEQFHAWLLGRIRSIGSQQPTVGRGAEQIPKLLAAALRPKLDGKRITLDLEPNGHQIGALYALAKPLIDTAKQAAARNQRDQAD